MPNKEPTKECCEKCKSRELPSVTERCLSCPCHATKEWGKKYAAFKTSLYLLNDSEVIDSVIKTMDSILSQAIQEAVSAREAELIEKMDKEMQTGYMVMSGKIDEEDAPGYSYARDQFIALIKE